MIVISKDVRLVVVQIREDVIMTTREAETIDHVQGINLGHGSDLAPQSVTIAMTGICLIIDNA